MSRDKTWSFQEQWWITGYLTTLTGLHVGSGEVVFHPELEADGKPVEINGVFRDVDNRPCIPGSTLKGALRSWLGDSLDKSPTKVVKVVDEIFGRPRREGDVASESPMAAGTVGQEKDNGQGGRAEFLDARLAFPLADPVLSLPYWDPARQTCIETGVAIDRHRRTALDQKLVHTEVVPQGVVFRVTVCGPMNEGHAGFLLALLECFNDPDRPILIGADTGSGRGRMGWELNEVKRFGRQEALAWLGLEERPMITEAMSTPGGAEIKSITRQGRQYLKEVTGGFGPAGAGPGPRPTVLDIYLRFDGPFLVNDPPSKSEKDEKSRLREKGEYSDNLPDHRPLRNISGAPRLPARSFRGALRSQAERIARTLGIKCCDPVNPCDPVYETGAVKALCQVCQLFGAAGWKSPLEIPDFRFVTCAADKVRQDFVAIDRFTGGAMPRAKFDADYVYKPEFQGKLVIDWDRLKGAGINTEPLKGLLALVLRDLQEGDICLGFGRAKGYGTCQGEIGGMEALDPGKSVQAFLKAYQQGDPGRDGSMSGWPGWTREAHPQRDRQERGPDHLFHNPYHFVPVTRPDTSAWLKAEDFSNDYKGHHTHACYYDRIGDKQVYNGRIICRLETKTPFFTGGRRIPGTDPQEICPFMLEGEPAIPATSLRGLLSSIVEAVSCSSLRALDDTLLSVRADYKKPLTEMGIIEEHEGDLKLRWLGKPKKHKLGIYDKIIIDEEKNPLSEHAKAGDGQNFERFFYMKTGKNKIPEFSSDNKGGKGDWIRGKFHVMDGSLRDFPGNKHNEYFIEVPEGSTGKAEIFDIKEALEAFHKMADLRTERQKRKKGLKVHEILPYHPLGTRRNADTKEPGRWLRLKAGDIVYCSKQGNRVNRISISQIWRKSRPRVWEFFSKISPELLPFNPERKHISPAELLFGFVEDRKKQKAGKSGQNQKSDAALAFADKVRVSFGRLAQNQDDDSIYDDAVTLKVLATPKPPSPALYFKNNGYVSKKDLKINKKILPQGRKFYLHCLQKNGEVARLTEKGKISEKQEEGFLPWESKSNHQRNQEDKRANLKARITPLKEGTVFYFHIDFDNLSREELELLCYSIRPDMHFQHKLGMGKPIGLGSVSIEPAGLLLINRGSRYRNGLDANATRYNDKVWLDERHKSEYSKLYPEESETATSENDALVPGQLAESFAQTMHPDIKKALELLGNPDNVTAPVHYPQVRDQDIEEENFKWFVANDVGTNNGKKGPEKQSKDPVLDYLEPLNKKSDKLPELERHEWLGK